jgi:hypothetical protein
MSTIKCGTYLPHRIHMKELPAIINSVGLSVLAPDDSEEHIASIFMVEL